MPPTTIPPFTESPYYVFNGAHHYGPAIWLLFLCAIIAGLAGGAMVGLLLYFRAASPE